MRCDHGRGRSFPVRNDAAARRREARLRGSGADSDLRWWGPSWPNATPLCAESGEGGMGAVYEARTRSSETRGGQGVAGKFLENQELVCPPAASRRGWRAQSVTRTSWTSPTMAPPAMSRVRGHGVLDGEALAQLVMRDAPLPVERSLGILRQVLQRAVGQPTQGHRPPRREARKHLPGATGRRRLREGGGLRRVQGRASRARTEERTCSA